VAASFGKFIIFRFWLSLTRISISVWRSYLPDVGPICAESPCIEDYFSVWYISELQILAEILRFKAASSFFQNLAIFKIYFDLSSIQPSFWHGEIWKIFWDTLPVSPSPPVQLARRARKQEGPSLTLFKQVEPAAAPRNTVRRTRAPSEC